VLEHINKPLPLLQELHRIAKPGAAAVIATPYGSSDDAWEDPTHVRPYFINSFGYFSQPYYWRADYGYRGDWRVKNIKLFVASAEITMATVHIARNVVKEMVVELEAVKPIRKPEKELQEAFPVELVV
jgi:SAM-dependent methyltransferase